MPTVDLSSYHQPTGSTSDGTKFDNLIDAIQTALNALDNNNIAAGAGIVASKLADPTTGKVLGSSGGACAAVYPPGYELAYDEFTVAVGSIAGTNIAGSTTVKTSTSYTFDGSTAVMIEFFCPYTVVSSTGFRLKFELFEDSTDIGELGVANSPSGGAAAWGVRLSRRRTPVAGAHTYTVKAFVPDGGTGTAGAGAGGSAGASVPGYVRVTKV